MRRFWLALGWVQVFLFVLYFPSLFIHNAESVGWLVKLPAEAICLGNGLAAVLSFTLARAERAA